MMALKILGKVILPLALTGLGIYTQSLGFVKTGLFIIVCGLLQPTFTLSAEGGK